MKNICSDAFRGVKNQLLIKLNRALRASELVEELQKFRAMHIANSLRSANRNISFEFTSLHRGCKNSFDLFCDAVLDLSDDEMTALDDFDLQQLFSHRTMEDIFPDNALFHVNIFRLDSYCRSLKAIYDYKPDSVNATRVDRIFTEEISSYGVENCVRCCRETAIRSFLVCMTVIGLGLLMVASGKQLTLEPLRHWSSIESTYYKTVIASLVFLLTIFLFQLITRIARPIQGPQLIDTGEGKSVFVNVFTFKASRRRIVVGSVGPVVLGLGTGVSVTAGFGAFGVTTMLDGLYQFYGVPFWLSQLVLSLICYLTAWNWGRITLGPGTIPALFLIGPAISIGAALAPQDLLFIGNLIAFVLGTLVFALGIAMTAAAALGPDGKTALCLAAEKASHWPIPQSAFFFNLSAIVIGITLGGNFGVATILNLFAVPVLLHYFIPPLRRYLSDKSV